MKTEEWLKGRTNGYLLGYREGINYEIEKQNQTIDDEVVELSMGKRCRFSVADVVDVLTKLKEIKHGNNQR